MPRRRSPAWVAVSFVLPRRNIEGLTLLTKGALNHLFQEHGLSQFCVEEAKPVPGRVRRFVVLKD